MDEILETTVDNLSPYDPGYPLRLLDEAFSLQIGKANRVASEIYDSIANGCVPAASFDASEKKSRLVVDIADDTVQDIHDGRIKLVEENNQLYAQLRENGHYSKKLPIKEEVYGDELSAYQAANALQLKAIQESLMKLNAQIKCIDESVRDIITGLQSDRIGLYYSGVALYMEASLITDPGMKQALLSQAIKALTEASFQLTLIMQEDIRYIQNKEYETQKKMRGKLIGEKMTSINQCFSIIHQSAILKAGIYCQVGEFSAMGGVLEEYSRYIAGTVAQNASLLAQCDFSDDGTLRGVWKSRANLRLDVSAITKRLRSADVPVYLTVKEQQDESV